MLRKPLAIYAKYSKNKKKALSTKTSKENLLEQKSKAEPTALTDYKKSLLFGEVCPASKKKKKEKHPEFRAPILFLEDFFFFFFFFYFFFPLALRTSLKRRNYSFSISLNIIPKFFCVSNSDLIRHHCTIFEKVFKNVKLSIKKNSISGRQISTGR